MRPSQGVCGGASLLPFFLYAILIVLYTISVIIIIKIVLNIIKLLVLYESKNKEGVRRLS